jgi:hypothetical protein
MSLLGRFMKPSVAFDRAALLVVACASLFGSVACGPQFDAGNEIKTLRVLGVKKDKPYAQPGDKVKLQLLWHDPEGRPDDAIQRAFIGGCINPPGDLYYGCFAQYGQGAATGAAPQFGLGDSFEVELPRDIISSRRDIELGQPRYGLYVVFFAVCAGTLDIDTGASEGAVGSEGLPLRCLDSKGEPLGSEDFVVGYSSIYSFDGYSNENPAFSVDDAGQGQFQVGSETIPSDCVGEACQSTAPVEVDCDATPERCVKACADDGDAACPAIDVKPLIEKKIEKDGVSSELFGATVTEQMWVNYYVDRGGISEVRLLNDTNSGWNEKYRGQLRAPKAAGPLLVWAVVHDNRGGMDFARVTLGVK